jgi:hypothetical protein
LNGVCALQHAAKFSPDLPEPARPTAAHQKPPSFAARTAVQGPTVTGRRPGPDLHNGYASHELKADHFDRIAPTLKRSEEELTRSALDRHTEALRAVALELGKVFPVACELLAELKRRG